MKSRHLGIAVHNALVLFWSAVLCVVVMGGMPDVVAAQEGGICKAGVHLLSPSDEDFRNAGFLVNSQGGRNCWVTIVLREDEMTVENLARIHNLAREYNIRLIHRIEKGFTANGQWLMPTVQTVQKFIRALNGITPAAKDVYVVLGNEPTHGVMCGACTPESFARWSSQAIDMLHAHDEKHDYDIHVGLAGQDVASPQQPENGLYDAAVFMDGMFQAEPDLLCKVDMWVSHSYPRSFVGSPHDVGRLSARGYVWELNFAQSRAKDDCKEHVAQLPVFITETGYKNGIGGVSDEVAYASTAAIMSYFEADPRVKAYTLFAYTYCGEPFEVFSLIPCSTHVENGNFATMRGGGRALYEAPKQAEIISHVRKARTSVVCPEKLVVGMSAECMISATNQGTDIWNNIEGPYDMRLIGAVDGMEHEFTRFRGIRPGETLSNKLTLTPQSVGEFEVGAGLMESGQLQLILAQWKLRVFDRPRVLLSVENMFGVRVTDQSGAVQIFDQNDDIVFRETVDINEGEAVLQGVGGVVFGTCYRMVLLVDQNLPVQKECVIFDEGENVVEMPRLLAVDRDGDGALTLSDVLTRFAR